MAHGSVPLRPYSVSSRRDNLVNQKAAIAMLKRCDVIPRVANNGVEAVAAVRETGGFALIFMDIQAREMHRSIMRTLLSHCTLNTSCSPPLPHALASC